MALNPNPTQQSIQQCAARMFDSENDAQRVVLVGGEKIVVNADVKMPEILQTQVVVKEVQVVEVPTIIKQYEKVEIPVLVRETQVIEIEKPIVIKEIEYRDVIREVIVKEVQVVTVEKPLVTTVYETIQVPVVVEKTINAAFPQWAKAILVVQALCAAAQLASHFLK